MQTGLSELRLMESQLTMQKAKNSSPGLAFQESAENTNVNSQNQRSHWSQNQDIS